MGGVKGDALEGLEEGKGGAREGWQGEGNKGGGGRGERGDVVKEKSKKEGKKKREKGIRKKKERGGVKEEKEEKKRRRRKEEEEWKHGLHHPEEGVVLSLLLIFLRVGWLESGLRFVRYADDCSIYTKSQSRLNVYDSIIHLSKSNST